MPDGGTLVVGPAWVGDLVMADVLLKRLKTQQPEQPITVQTTPALLQLAERLSGADAAIALDTAHGELALGRRRAQGRQLRERAFSRAYVLPNSFKAALVPFWAEIPYRCGWLGEFRYWLLNDPRRLDKARYPLQIERFLALAEPPGAALTPPYPQPRLRVEPQRTTALKAQHGLTSERAVLALAPGAEYGPAKRWPAEHFAAVARAALERGWDVWVFGADGDRGLADAIVAGAATPGRDDVGQLVNLCGRTSLADVVDLLAATAAVVCNDSGIMHIAAALDTQVIALYGSSSPAFTPPLSLRATVLEQTLDCRPCFERDCPLGHTNCLRTLTPERALAALGWC